MTEEDELFRYRMHCQGPPGFWRCTRDWPHDGPCAHPPKGPPPDDFKVDYEAWLDQLCDARHRFQEAMPCIAGASCGYHVETCRNCKLSNEAAHAIAGPPPDPRDYR